MCIICTTGQQAALDSTERLANILSSAINYPIASNRSRERLKKAFAEFVLAIHEAYVVPLKDGTTEEEARRDFEATVDTLITARKKEANKLALLFGVNPDELEDIIEQLHGEGDDTAILTEEFIN